MIDLMLDSPSQQLLAFQLKPLPASILRPHLHPRRARHLLPNLRETKASFLLHLFPATIDDATTPTIRSIYAELGAEALKEQAEWVAIYRQRPIEPPK